MCFVLGWTVLTACPDGPYRLPWRTVPPALSDRTACPDGPYRRPCQGLLSCELLEIPAADAGNILLNINNRSSSPKSHIAGQVIFLVDPCLLLAYESPYSNLGWSLAAESKSNLSPLPHWSSALFQIFTNNRPGTVSDVEKHWNKKIKGVGQTATHFHIRKASLQLLASFPFLMYPPPPLLLWHPCCCWHPGYCCWTSCCQRPFLLY